MAQQVVGPRTRRVTLTPETGAGADRTAAKVWGVLTALRLATLLAASPTAYPVLKVLGVAYLLFLVHQALRSASREPVAVAAAMPVRGRGLLALVLIHVLTSVGWLGGYAYLLDRAGAVLQRPGVRRGMERVTGVVLIGFAGRLALARA